MIKDQELADEFAAVESDPGLSANDSRARVAEAVNRHYTGPASEAASRVVRREAERSS